ncbi:MAG: cell division protein FtsZ [Methanobacteriota archaeon]|uniref:Cell division protein FtsZ n=1 Tax=Marine Group III euryarchaeote TaxID=2173149 RepID=A0A7C7ZCQ5_9ARCH|nr:MAG: cell division protein FtsZ [Euryarchaeota archaeon]HIG63035.1 cell division protein FtsZ [Marine Group III euryarchaeote]HIL32705.1 cell division protein FtsZ [Candidatus Poseidoniales archaeon]
MPEDESPAEAPAEEEPQEPATEVKQERLEANKGFSGEANERELQELVANLNTNILIIGAGGAGNNTLERLYREGIDGVEMLALNTDAQHLLAARVPHRMLIGKQLTKGLGAGAEPHLGEGAAEEARDDLLNACHEADIVFLTGGLGGGTGTGALPVIARFAKEKQALTIAIVTLPFSNEGARRAKNAQQGLERLRKVADTVIVIPNDKLLQEDIAQLPLNEAFRKADAILGGAIRCMSEITTRSGLVNIDFADLRSIMESGGVAMIGTGEAQGTDRAAEAVQSAFSSPLLEVDISQASGALINVTGGDDMTLHEAHAVVREVNAKINKEARIIWGASIDSSLEHSIRVMLVVTGVKSSQILGPPEGVEDELVARYGIDFVQ